MSDPSQPGGAVDPSVSFSEGADTQQAVADADSRSSEGEARSLWSDAWREMRGNPLFWISAVLILFFVILAVAPGLFTNKDPYFGDLGNAVQSPSGAHWFGTDTQGYDIYARTLYGARSSILVGVFATLFTLVLGSIVGIISGYLGGWVDALLSRVGEVFFAIPLLLGGILFLYTFPSSFETPYPIVVGKVVFAISILGWPAIARLMRSSVLQVKPNDYVQAARALGASPLRIITSHILPNAVAPVIVVSTINLGTFIAVEATLSFLGIGLQPPAISWGLAISEASQLGLIRTAPFMLVFPSIFLSITVLAFILLGDAVRDALDPKLR